MHDLSEFEPAITALAARLRARGWHMATAESCTGGLVAAACTAIAGSSDWFDRGFVCYSNAAKSEQLGVDPALIAARGAVSTEVACAMARGAIAHSHAAIAVAITGIAGPTGGVADKPVGTVWIAIARRDRASAHATLLQLTGDRRAIRDQSVAHALAALQAAAAG